MKGLPKTKRCNSVAVTVSVRFRFGFGVYVKWPFLVCCIIGNVNVKVKCVDLDRAALVWAVWATREV